MSRLYKTTNTRMLPVQVGVTCVRWSNPPPPDPDPDPDPEESEDCVWAFKRTVQDTKKSEHYYIVNCTLYKQTTTNTATYAVFESSGACCPPFFNRSCQKAELISSSSRTETTTINTPGSYC